MAALVAKEKWDTNAPAFKDVLRAWVSPLKAAIEDDKAILESVTDQKWKGIDIKDFWRTKGQR